MVRTFRLVNIMLSLFHIIPLCTMLTRSQSALNLDAPFSQSTSVKEDRSSTVPG